ncbi:elongin C [Knufia obscura]|uniref:E3 ubiquitin ligase complex SCF subunit sconC n=2 Tax=Knufia TaxID=430999 RepID=A0AAN8EPQ8_9EURO|nr:elongin C [Knufia obscura]KAK5951346.1 elongin C [Knufia fluminis]
MTDTNKELSPYVTLVSADGFEFHVRRSAACVSGTIRRMLDVQNNFSEAQSGICHLENLSGIVLEKVVEYFYYNEKHKESTGVADMDIPPDLCLELLMAADYLDT